MERFKRELATIKLPNSLWAAHADPDCTFVVYMHLLWPPGDSPRILVDKALMLTFVEETVRSRVYLNGEAVEVPELLKSTIETVHELAHFLVTFEELELCQGDHPDCKKYSKPGSGNLCALCSSTKGNKLDFGSDFQNEKKCDLCGEYVCEHTSLKEHAPSRLYACDSRAELSPEGPETCDGRSYLCSTCGKRFNGKYHMESHMLTHDIDKKHECCICLKKFASGNNLKIHRKSHSDEKRPYSCNTCGKGYTTPSNLSTHVKSNHVGDKPYRCTVCESAFVHPRLLRIHMRKHTGERPFACKTCTKTFAKKVHLTIHQRTHTGEKPFECLICGKGFTTTGNLQSHRRVHQKEPSS